ncbi:translocation and assembly module TamA [Pararhizobium capsulatum DSM 1112]|uniref:Translocation and assembly module TamA n=1 Tax=Pararhizobium capsulatum DSM 1112 TaxID=1121113 RepID=A0ABU0BHX8_9HYPH|nr:autotransporter assembly complex family protein [Pararhizobium capsulatum]MDQ0317863.1 translocation and assembly module TamA [Pararhizobium capsulatum DSM 1112]
MRKRLPTVSNAYRKTGTALAVLAAVLCGPLSLRDANAFKIFGMSFFENDEEPNEVIDPVNYSLDLETGTADDDLKESLENASRLFQEKDQPVSGNLGLVIRARDDRDRLLAALYENARYGGVISITVNGQDIDSLPPDPVFPAGAPVPVAISVTPGPVFTIGKVTLEGDASGKNPADYDLVAGAQANSTLIIKAGEQVVEDLKEEGRPLAKLTNRAAVADHKTNTVDVDIAAEGGPVAPFGTVTVTGTKTVDPQFVARYSRLDTGRRYSPEEIRKANERLRALGVFASITIKEPTALAPDGSLPLTIEVSEGKHRYFGGGVQYSTTDGFGVQGYWGHRNLFGQAESLKFEGSVNRIGENDISSLDYNAGLIFAKPGAFGPASTFNASLKASLLDPDAYKATIFTGAAGVTYELSDTDTISGGGELSWANVDDAFGKNEYLTAALPFEYVRDTRDNKLNPTEGYRGSINAKPSYEIDGQTFFSSFEGSIAGYYGLGEENGFVLAGRLNAGVIVGGDGLVDIPANRRFYLGGGGTVRGYSYQEISPRNDDDELLGGRSYVNATIEARIGITDTIGLVPFVDVGTVSAKTAPDFSDIKAGAGVGLRYLTPFGPIRLDVAVPLNPYPGGTSYGIYAGIGQSF